MENNICKKCGCILNEYTIGYETQSTEWGSVLAHPCSTKDINGKWDLDFDEDDTESVSVNFYCKECNTELDLEESEIIAILKAEKLNNNKKL